MIENAIKFTEREGEINVNIILNQDGILVTVEDNGNGFSTKVLLNPGMGIKNIRSRVEFLNGKLDFDSQLGVGTTVDVEVPV